MSSYTSFSSKKDANSIEDMVLISKVTDPTITENLKKRYLADSIYTYIGPTLVAVNPYKKLPATPTDMYNGVAAYELPPHVIKYPNPDLRRC